jgi:hypothetical protein
MSGNGRSRARRNPGYRLYGVQRWPCGARTLDSVMCAGPGHRIESLRRIAVQRGKGGTRALPLLPYAFEYLTLGPIAMTRMMTPALHQICELTTVTS